MSPSVSMKRIVCGEEEEEEERSLHAAPKEIRAWIDSCVCAVLKFALISLLSPSSCLPHVQGYNTHSHSLDHTLPISIHHFSLPSCLSKSLPHSHSIVHFNNGDSTWHQRTIQARHYEVLVRPPTTTCAWRQTQHDLDALSSLSLYSQVEFCSVSEYRNGDV